MVDAAHAGWLLTYRNPAVFIFHKVACSRTTGRSGRWDYGPGVQANRACSSKVSD